MTKIPFCKLLTYFAIQAYLINCVGAGSAAPCIPKKNSALRPLASAITDSESGKKPNQLLLRLQESSGEYKDLIARSRTHWLADGQTGDGTHPMRFVVTIPDAIMNTIIPVGFNILQQKGLGVTIEVTIDGKKILASEEDPLDMSAFTPAEYISIILSLPDLDPSGHQPSSREHMARKCFAWPSTLLDKGLFDIKLADNELTADAKSQAGDIASVVLSLEGDTVCIKEFVINPAFRLLGIATELFKHAVKKSVETASPSALRKLRFEHTAIQAWKFVSFLAQDSSLIVGPFNLEAEYWFLGEYFTGQPPAPLPFLILPGEENPFTVTSNGLLKAVHTVSQYNTDTSNYHRAIIDVGSAWMTMVAALGLQKRYGFYTADMTEFGEYAPAVIGMKDHKLWRTQTVSTPWGSRYSREPSIFLKGEKWIFESLASGNIPAHEINDLTRGVAEFDHQKGTWIIHDRLALVKRLSAAYGYDPTDAEIVERDIRYFEKHLQQNGNAITYQAIYAPRTEPSHPPVLLGIIWVLGDMNSVQREALQSFAFQAGYALDKIHRINSLAARKRQMELTNTRYRKLLDLDQKLRRIRDMFHSMRNIFATAGGFTGSLIRSGAISGTHTERTRTTIESAMSSTMEAIRNSHEDIAHMRGQRFDPDLRMQNPMVTCHHNLAAFLIQANTQKDWAHIRNERLGLMLNPLPEDLEPIDLSRSFILTLQELDTELNKLSEVYQRTVDLFAGITTQLYEVFNMLDEYMHLPLDEMRELAKGGKPVSAIRDKASDAEYVESRFTIRRPNMGEGRYAEHPLSQNGIIRKLAIVNKLKIEEIIDKLTQAGLPLDNDGLLRGPRILLRPLIAAVETAGLDSSGIELLWVSQGLWHAADKRDIDAANVVIDELGSNLPEMYRQLLDFIKGGSTEEPALIIRLDDLVRKTLGQTIIRNNFRLSNIEVEHKTGQASTPIMVKVRANAFAQFVLTELLANVAKYMGKPRGKITISYEFTRDGFVDLIIQDTGIGMSEEHIDRVFKQMGIMAELDPEHAKTLGQRRSGIGLFSARELMLSMGGDLIIEKERTKEGEGSCFIVRIPLSKVEVGEDVEDLERAGPITTQGGSTLLHTSHIINMILASA